MSFDFSAVAARYATYRPHYPTALVDLLADLAPAHDLAWDVGCGNGQLSVALAGRFARVIATDPSQRQLDEAVDHERVTYRKGAAELGIAERCDLVVAAQAAHWFDWPKFVAAVARDAKPGALAAAVSYGRMVISGEAGRLLDTFYDDVVGPYWPDERSHVHDHYARLNWPWPAIAAPAIAMIEAWTRDELLGYLGTWSATTRYVAAHGTSAIDELAARLATVWPDGTRVEIRWPLTVKLSAVNR